MWENFTKFYKKNFQGKNFYLASQWVTKNVRICVYVKGTAEIEFFVNN